MSASTASASPAIASAIRLSIIVSDGKPANDTFDLSAAILSGERAERHRIIRYLVGLAENDAYEYESPGVLAERLLAGVHRQEGR